MRHLGLALFLAPLALTGCGAASFVLKGPLESQCTDAGLKGCPALTDGVLTYVGGDETAGKKKIAEGASKNSPEKLQKFATALRTLDKLPGTEKLHDPLNKVADLLAGGGGGEDDVEETSTDRRNAKSVDKKEASVAPPPASHAVASRAAGATMMTADQDPDRLDGGVAAPSMASDRGACGALASAGYGACVKVATGPLVVTDLTMMPGCPADTLVGSAKSTDSVESLRWIVSNPTNVSGARFFVRKGESLYVGVQSTLESRIKPDARCVVSWSGFHPYDAPAAK